MNRREMIKVATLATLATVTASAYDAKLIANTNKMAPKDPKNMNNHEHEHTPEITIGSKDKAGYTLVEVNMGENGMYHKSIATHWIYEMELYADGNKVASVNLEPVISRGYLGTRIKLDGVKKLEATAKCNLDGIWTTTKVL